MRQHNYPCGVSIFGLLSKRLAADAITLHLGRARKTRGKLESVARARDQGMRPAFSKQGVNFWVTGTLRRIEGELERAHLNLRIWAALFYPKRGVLEATRCTSSTLSSLKVSTFCRR